MLIADVHKGNDATLGQVAYENLKKPEIKTRIAELRMDAEQSAWERIMSAREIVARLSLIAEGDIGDLVNDRGELDLEMARRTGKSYLLKKLKVTRSIERTPRRSSRLAARDDEGVSPNEQSLMHEYELMSNGSIGAGAAMKLRTRNWLVRSGPRGSHVPGRKKERARRWRT